MVTGYSVKSWQSQIVRTDTQVFFLIVFSFIYFFPWRVPEVYCFCLLFFCLAPSSSSFSQNFFFLSLSRNSHTVASTKCLIFCSHPQSALILLCVLSFLVLLPHSWSWLLSPNQFWVQQASIISHQLSHLIRLLSNFPFFESDLTKSNFSLSSDCSIVSPSSVLIHLDWLLT